MSIEVPVKPVKSVQLEKGQVSAEDSPGPGSVRELNKGGIRAVISLFNVGNADEKCFMKT